MTPFNRDYELGKHYQHQQQDQAQRHQLASVARANQPKRHMRIARIYKPTLFKLGKRLESIGTTLQVRYGDLKPSPSNR